MNKQVKARLKRVALDFESAIEVLCDVVLPVIEKEVESDTYAAELSSHIARVNEELNLYLKQGKAEKEAMLSRLKEESVILETTKYQLENVTLLAEELTLTKMLVSASIYDIKEAVKNALMIGDRGKILRTLKEVIEEVEG